MFNVSPFCHNVCMKREIGVTKEPIWHLEPVDEGRVSDLARETGLSRITTRVLVSRGMDSADKISHFVSPNLTRDWCSPFLLSGMHDAVDVVERVIREHRRIVVFGDFDLDGISATALLTRGLRAFSGYVQPFIPSRFDEGYGLSPLAMERMIAELDPECVITVDCGIANGSEVAWLAARGIQVVVTDHHEPSGMVPQGVPVIDPKLDPDSPSYHLAGAGVALKLVDAVGDRFGLPDHFRSLVDLASLGTIADLMPLRDENRSLVAEGVELMHRHPRPGITALCETSGTTPDQLSADGISFSLSPRLNAAGRMGDAMASLRLLLTDDPAEAQTLALQLDSYNRQRQELEFDLAAAATAKSEREYAGERVLIVGDEGWHEGIKGIVASRLVGRFGVPALLFSIVDGVARGSGRSVGDVDLFAAVESVSDMLTRYGGHKAAVGVTLPAQELPLFKKRLLEHLDALPEEQFRSTFPVDAVVRLDDLSIELMAELDALRPFGNGNRKPLFVSECVFMNGRQRVGKTEDHLRFTAYDGIAEIPAIAFRCNDIESLSSHDAPVDVVFEPAVDEWRGRKRLQLVVRGIDRCPVEESSRASELVEQLFERADEFLARDEYAGIADEPYFNTKLAGVTFDDRQEHIAALKPGTPLRLQRDFENSYDANACAVYAPSGAQIGYLNARLASVLAPAIDGGVEYDMELTAVTGGEEGKTYGANVMLSRRDLVSPDAEDEAIRAVRLDLARLAPDELEKELVRRFIGSRDLHPAQVESLARLAEGKGVLTVMATGRGKSLIFHLHAAKVALLDDAASVFVFPLRALVADQAFHLSEAFSKVGIVVRTLTGESSQSERDEAFDALREGLIDVVLTTPEFLHFNAQRFAQSGRIRFMVVDEAHHVGRARAGHRPAYLALGAAREALGRPTVLAVTATADRASAETIQESLGIDVLVTDPTVRENLRIEDRRNHLDKDGYLAALVAHGGKTIVYVNSREQTVKLARMLRKRVPSVGHSVAFYNGGMSRGIRQLVESAFRAGDLSVVVATSAFGEGVNIPDVRNVVLYHMPFNAVEFNQMSGRGGRDGAAATVHLLFGNRDARINEMILSSSAPSREDMVAIYRALKATQEEEGPGFEITNADIAERALRVDRKFSLDERGVSSALGIFRELRLVTGEGHGAYRRLTLVPDAERVDLESSIRYLEGLDEIAQFAEFKEWVLESEALVLLERFNRPILPCSD